MQYESSNIYFKIMKSHKGLIPKEYSGKNQSSNTHCSKVISKVQVFKKKKKLVTFKVTVSKIMVLTERSYHRKYSCEISKL